MIKLITVLALLLSFNFLTGCEQLEKLENPKIKIQDVADVLRLSKEVSGGRNYSYPKSETIDQIQENQRSLNVKIIKLARELGYEWQRDYETQEEKWVKSDKSKNIKKIHIIEE